jgi:1-acyl-sn-glycerol-3-phosphate acyltransferase
MSDLTYRLIRDIGYHAFWVSSSPVWLHRERVPRRGPVILAPTHLSPFDVPCIMASLWRPLDFMSVAEFLKKPWVARFFRAMNCLFLDRGRIDPATMREAVRRLQRGRALVMFPEGRIREWKDSVVHGHPFKPGVARIAQMTGTPVIPCVVLGTDAYMKSSSWLPLQKTKYGINYGQPLTARKDLPPEESQAELTARLAAAYVDLYRELRQKMPPGTVPPDPATATP